MRKSRELTKVKVANRPEQSRDSSRAKSRIVQNRSRELTKSRESSLVRICHVANCPDTIEIIVGALMFEGWLCFTVPSYNLCTCIYHNAINVKQNGARFLVYLFFL